MAERPQDTDTEEFLCVDDFPPNTTILIHKPKTGERAIYVYSEHHVFLERVTLDAYVAYRCMRAFTEELL